MTTAQDRLNQILPSWKDLLTQWSVEGSLVAAATDALVLDSSNAKQDAKGQLQSFVSQWSVGNFQNLPKIVLLSTADISGAQGAYADSTDTIYLNQAWLLTATEEEIQKVLTEELGHYLDDQLNERDTEGDEGAYFSSQLFKVNFYNEQLKTSLTTDDSISLLVGDQLVQAEAASVTSLTIAFRGTSLYAIVPGPTWQEAEASAVTLGGHLVTITDADENDFVKSFVEPYASLNLAPTANPDTGYYVYDDLGAWIGLNYQSNNWTWSSGESVSYINFFGESNAGSGFDYAALYAIDSKMAQPAGYWNDHESTMSMGVAEIPYTQYQDSAYVIVTGNTFEEARQNAQLLGGDLVILNSQAEFDFLVNTYQGYQAEWQSLWLGLTDSAEEGKWLNVDGTLAGYAFNGEQNYLPWHLGEPNNFQDEDYGVLNWSQYWAEQYSLGREGVMHPAALNDINNFTAAGYDKPIYGIAEIKLPQPADIIGTAASDASRIIVSGDLTNPRVESVESITTGKGRNKVTTPALTDISIDQQGPLDALVVNGGAGNNNISGQGFADDPNTGTINETRSAFSGVLLIDGKGGADAITGGVSGTNWLIGGGVAGGSVDTLTGTASSMDIFDLRQSSTSGIWLDAYSSGGNAVINNFDPLNDLIVLSGDSYSYKSKETPVFKGKRQVGTKIGGFDIFDSSDKLIGSVLGNGFTDTDFAKYVLTGQNSQSPFDVILPDGSTII